MFKDVYGLIKKTYKYLSATNVIGDVFAIPLNVFNEFI
jgi:hypothetical protein